MERHSSPCIALNANQVNFPITRQSLLTIIKVPHCMSRRRSRKSRSLEEEKDLFRREESHARTVSLQFLANRSSNRCQLSIFFYEESYKQVLLDIWTTECTRKLVSLSKIFFKKHYRIFKFLSAAECIKIWSFLFVPGKARI